MCVSERESRAIHSSADADIHLLIWNSAAMVLYIRLTEKMLHLLTNTDTSCHVTKERVHVIKQKLYTQSHRRHVMHVISKHIPKCINL